MWIYFFSTHTRGRDLLRSTRGAAAPGPQKVPRGRRLLGEINREKFLAGASERQSERNLHNCQEF